MSKIQEAKEALERAIAEEVGLQATVRVHVYCEDNDCLENSAIAAAKACSLAQSLDVIPVYDAASDIGWFKLGNDFTVFVD